MNEKPIEWMTEGRESTGHMVGRISSLAAAIVLFIFSLKTGMLFAVLGSVIFTVLFAWLQAHALVEYEYFYLDEDVEISVIYNRKRRKRKIRFHLKEVECMLKKIELGENTRYLCHKGDFKDICTLLMNQEGKRFNIIMETTPEFVKVMEKKRKIR